MNPQIAFNVISKSFTLHANSLMKLEFDVNAGAAATVYVQLHDFPSPADLAAGRTAPVNGSVPIKSWPTPAGAIDVYKEFKNGELDFNNGVFAVVSTTQATLTIGTGSNKFDSVAAEVWNPDLSGSTVVQASSPATASSTIWADGTPHRLVRFSVTELNGDGQTRYVMLFAQSPTNNVSVPIIVWTLPSGTTISKTFSTVLAPGGLFPMSQDKNLVNHNGCYIAVSADVNVLNTDGPYNIYAEYI